MYLGDINNLGHYTKLSSDTLKTLSDFNFIERYFESKFKFDSIKLQDNEIITSLRDLQYLEKMGFYKVQESHLYNSFLIATKHFEDSYKFNLFENAIKQFTKPDIVFNRLKGNLIEEISFHKSLIENNDILKIATKAKYYKSGKFFRDNSNSGFIFSKYLYLGSVKKPYTYFKFNKYNVAFNYYSNSQNKYEKKQSFTLPLMDCFRLKKNEDLFSFFGRDISLNNIIQNFENLKNIQINSKTDLLTILSDNEIELLKIISF